MFYTLDLALNGFCSGSDLLGSSAEEQLLYNQTLEQRYMLIALNFFSDEVKFNERTDRPPEILAKPRKARAKDSMVISL